MIEIGTTIASAITAFTAVHSILIDSSESRRETKSPVLITTNELSG